MDNKEKSFVSAVVYAHNSGKDICSFMEMLINELEKNFESSEIILVNDHSTDGSIEMVKDICHNASTCSVSIVHLSYFHGLETAMNAGNDLAIGDIIFEFDSTLLDYPADTIMNAYKELLAGNDIVGVAPDKDESFSSKMFYRVFEHFTGTKMCSERFRVVSRRLINRVNSVNKTVPYRKQAYLTAGFHSKILRYKQTADKSYVKDKAEQKNRSKLAVDSLILFTEFGYRLSKFLTISMMIISLFMIIYSIVVYVSAQPVEGWSTTVLFLSISFFGLFAILTIIVRYLQLLVNLVFKHKRYCFDNIEKITK